MQESKPTSWGQLTSKEWRVRKMALVTGILEKGTSGRKPKPLDETLIGELTELFAEGVAVDGMAKVAGPDTQFDSRGKANADGRKYADKIGEVLKTKFR